MKDEYKEFFESDENCEMSPCCTKDVMQYYYFALE